MQQLIDLPFTPPPQVNQLISPLAVKDLMAQITDWDLVVDETGEHLTAQFKPRSYANGMIFCQRIAQFAESVNHHPKIVFEYATVTVCWWTHTLQGLHLNDFIAAAKTTELFHRPYD